MLYNTTEVVYSNNAGVKCTLASAEKETLIGSFCICLFIFMTSSFLLRYTISKRNVDFNNMAAESQQYLGQYASVAIHLANGTIKIAIFFATMGCQI